jgi:hypothetical protein
MSTQPTFDINQYLKLLDLTYQVTQSLKGKPSSDPRWFDCQQLAAKLFFHAATVYDLRFGTKVPLLSSMNGADFYDFASVAVITRAALETYLTLFEVFFEPATDDEFEFSHALWKLSGFVVRENYIPADPELQSQFTNAQQEIQDMRNRLQKTAKFASMACHQQKEVLKGKRKRARKSVANAAGFGQQTIEGMYAYYSGYVHADGLSGAQIEIAKTAHEQIEHIEFHMKTVMVVMSKMIVGYAKKFPEAKAACNTNMDTFYIAETLAQAVSRMP